VKGVKGPGLRPALDGLVQGCCHLLDQDVEQAVDLRWCDGLFFYSSANALRCAF
jgi:hypothetical protein